MMDSMGESKERVVCDYIAGMTDRYAINIFQDVIMPMSWRIY
jgi:dGTPase